jgi:SAM-dependent methyltransferase
MADQAGPAAETPMPATEVYTQRHNPAFVAEMATRIAGEEAAFFLPNLRPGMHLLDVGCGPGSITAGLAEVVAPGTLVGIDLEAAQLVRARSLVAEQGVMNAFFGVANLYQLPFADASFDAVFAHTVVMGLREPVRALTELRRVLRPRGIIGLRDPDLGTEVIAPATPLLEQRRAFLLRVRQYNGGYPFAGRQLRGYLLAAGFTKVEARASVWSAGSLEETRLRAGWFKAQLLGLAGTGLAEGWIDQQTVDAMDSALDEWAERPDAFSAVTYGEAIGRVSN